MHELRVDAERLDRDDPLASFASRFASDDSLLYLDGNSLGRMPLDAANAVSEELATWRTDLVMGWDQWLDRSLTLGDELAPLLGARSGEVAVCDQTSVNLYKLAEAAFSATDRTRIVTDAGNFPSDLYVLGEIARRSGGTLDVLAEDPTPVEIGAALDDDVALVAMTHVGFRSGIRHDGAEVTRLAHDVGALMLWDLAHSAGALRIDLDGWGADLAVGCTYKYLNGGPGSPGFLFVREELQDDLRQPIAGWFGHDDQFGFDHEYSPAPDVRRFLVGTPSILSLAATGVGIRLSVEAGIDAIEAKAASLTSLFIEAVDTQDIDGASVATPREAFRRGAHVAIRHDAAYQISLALRDRGVIVDYRAPDLVRFGFSPLTTSHGEAVAAAEHLAEVVREGEWTTFSRDRSGVT